MPRKTLLLCVSLLFCAACVAHGNITPEPTPGATASLTRAPIPSFPSPITSSQPPIKTPPVIPSPSPSETLPPVITRLTSCASTGFIPVAFLPPNGRLLGRTETELRIIDPSTGQETSFLKPSRQMVTAALSPDGQTLALAFVDHSLQLIRMTDKQQLSTLTGHLDRITALRFTPTGGKLVSASLDTWVRLWSLDGKLISKFQPGGADNFPAEVLGIGISPDGDTLGTISSEGPLKLWDMSTSLKKAEFEGSISGGYDGSEVLFSKDGKFMAESLGGGGQISLWKLLDGALLWRGGIFAAAFSPDGRSFAYTDADEQGNNIVVLLSTDRQEVNRVLKGHLGLVWKLVFSPDGAILASTDDSEMRLWRVDNGQVIFRRLTNCPPSTTAPNSSGTP
jgi:WD40 repeat protein